MLYNKLKEAIFKADPELEKEVLELKKGCKFIWTNEKFEEENFEIERVICFENLITDASTFEIQATKIDKDVYAELYNFDSYYEDSGNYFLDIAKIIGRPLTLEDVLRVLENSVIPMGDYSLDDGYFNIYKIESDEPEIEWSWQLGKTLEEQSEETQKELLKILS